MLIAKKSDFTQKRRGKRAEEILVKNLMIELGITKERAIEILGKQKNKTWSRK